MKEIRETKMIEQTTVKFVASNGKEFTGENAESLCKDYERRLDEEKVEKEFNKLDSIIVPLEILEAFGGDDYKLYRIKLNNRQDFIKMEDYFSIRCYETTISEPEVYPTTVTIGMTYDYAWRIKHFDLVEDLQKSLDIIKDFDK